MNRAVLIARARTTLYVEQRAGHPVLLKVLNESQPTRREVLAFFNELEISRELDHPGVRKAIGKDRVDGRQALVLQHVAGETLELRKLRRAEELPALLGHFAQLCEAVAYLHGRHIIHRDLKPANILYDARTDRLVIIDFGLATRFDSRTAADQRPEQLHGTLHYMAPEQTGRTNRRVDDRADLYALGTTLYHVLTGRPPFDGADPMAIVHGHLAQTPLPPSELAPLVPPILSQIVLKLLAKDPQARYQSALGLRDDLVRCLKWLGDRTQPVFALAQTDVHSQLRLPETLYGRLAEVAKLEQAFARAADGPPELALITGFSGAGKSSVVHEVQQPVAARRGWYCEGKCDQLQRGIPYHAIGQALTGLVGQWSAAPEAELLAHRTHLGAALGDLAGLLLPVVPNLPLVLGPVALPAPATDEEARRRFLYAVRSFVRAAATAQQPLVLFVDDLQWADLGSLQVLEALASDHDGAHLLLIGAYRDNEVDASHALSEVLRRLVKAGVRQVHLHIGHLPLEHVAQLVADTLNWSVEQATPLAELVVRKSAGNPFAIRQFLETLHQHGVLKFEVDRRAFVCDLSAAHLLDVPDNVVELVASRIQRLPPATQQCLQLASCIGNRFAVQAVATLRQATAAQTAADLAPGLSDGLLAPLGDADRLLGGRFDEAEYADVQLAFAHDRVYQAAYTLVADSDRPGLHQRVARQLLHGAPTPRPAGLTFDIANHLNAAYPVLSSAAERQQALEINVEAARLAAQAAAHQQVAVFADAAASLLTADGWRLNYSTALEIFSLSAEAGCMLGEPQRVQTAADHVHAHAKVVTDRLRVFAAQLEMARLRDDLHGAIATGRQALAELGITFAAQPKLVHLILATVATKIAIGRLPLAQLATLPAMTDLRWMAAVRIMEIMAPPAFRSGSKLFPLLVLKIVHLSVKHGVLPASAFGFGGFALMTAGIFNDIPAGTVIGNAALQVAERFGDDRYRASAAIVYNMFVRHWTEPLDAVSEPLMQAHQRSMATGRAFEAAWALCYRQLWMVAAGAELSEVAVQASTYAQAMTLDVGAQRLWRLNNQLVANLRGEAADAQVLAGPHYHSDEATAANGADATEIAFHCAYALRLAYTFGDWPAATRWAAALQANLEALVSMPLDPEARFFAAMTDIHTGAPQRRARSVLAKLAGWSRSCPANYESKYLLLRAELATTAADTNPARVAFDLAIAAARRHQNAPDEALACERAAAFYRRLDSPLAAHCLRDAERAWLAWGALAKVSSLQTSFTHLRHQTLAPQALRDSLLGVSTPEHARMDAVDVASLLAASRAVAAEIVLERLLHRLAEIVLQTAGGDRGLLFLQRNGALVLAAEVDVLRSVALVLQNRPLNEDDVCAAVVRRVARSGEGFIGDPRSDANLRKDPYIRKNGVQSVLALPISHQGKLAGVWVAEHHQAAGAFAAHHLQTLELVASQAAISLKNAQLYTDLQSSLDAQVLLNSAHKRFVPVQFLESVGRTGIEQVRLGDSAQKTMTVMFSDIRGFTTMVEGMRPEEHIGFINEFLHHMDPAIRENGGFVNSFIGDAILALFDGAADRAVRAGIGMVRALKILNAERNLAGKQPIRIGIGLNTGILTLGTMGSADHLKCGVLGDSVNLSARVESLTKMYGVTLMITGHTQRALTDSASFAIRAVDRVRVMGKVEVVELFEVYSGDEAASVARKTAAAADHQAGCSAFWAGDLVTAATHFEACLHTTGPDAVVEALLARCQNSAGGRPQDWTGVRDLDHK